MLDCAIIVLFFAAFVPIMHDERKQTNRQMHFLLSYPRGFAPIIFRFIIIITKQVFLLL